MRIERAMMSLRGPVTEYENLTFPVSRTMQTSHHGEFVTGESEHTNLVSGQSVINRGREDMESGMRSNEPDSKSRTGYSHGVGPEAVSREINIVDQDRQRRAQTRSGGEYMHRRRRVTNN